MASKERRERERERMRELILEAANQVATRDGIENLSIRKIAELIEYSPATIYRYFRDKEEIVDLLLGRGFQRIVGTLSSTRQLHPDPNERLKGFARGYIRMALSNPEEYRSFLLSDLPGVLAQTSVLFRGASSQRSTVAMLCQTLREILGQETGLDDEWFELTAQVFWAAGYGLIIRSMIEGTPPDQMERLIERHVDFVSEALQGVRMNVERKNGDHPQNT